MVRPFQCVCECNPSYFQFVKNHAALRVKRICLCICSCISPYDLTNPIGCNSILVPVLTNALGRNLISVLSLTNPLACRLISAYQPLFLSAILRKCRIILLILLCLAMPFLTVPGCFCLAFVCNHECICSMNFKLIVILIYYMHVHILVISC